MCDAGVGEENSKDKKFSVSTSITATDTTVESVLKKTRRGESGKKLSSLNRKGESGTKPPLCLRDLTENNRISATEKIDKTT